MSIQYNKLLDSTCDISNREIIKNRFEAYNSQTKKLIPFYDEKGILFNINGMQEIHKVFEEIKKILGI